MNDGLFCCLRALTFPVMPEVGFDPRTPVAQFITVARVAAAIALTALTVALAITSAILDATVVASPAGLAVGICCLVAGCLAIWVAAPIPASFKWSFSTI